METYEGSEMSEAVDVDVVQREAAETATTVSGFKSEFHIRMDHALQAGGDEEEFRERAVLVDEMAKVGGDLRLQRMQDSSVLGFARKKSDKSTVRMNEKAIANVADSADAQILNHAFAHEVAHTRSKAFGTLVFQGDVVTDWAWSEGVAEIAGNKEVGMGLYEHRDGQPDDYRGAQDTMVGITAVVGESIVHEAVYEKGDLTIIQDALDREGQGRNEE